MTPNIPQAVRELVAGYRRFLRTSYRFLDEHLRRIDPNRKRRYRELEAEPYHVRFPDRDRAPRAFALDRPDHIRKAGKLMGFVQENPRAGQRRRRLRRARSATGTGRRVSCAPSSRSSSRRRFSSRCRTSRSREPRGCSGCAPCRSRRETSAWPDGKLAVYCDGFAFHGNPDTLELDARKRNFLQSHGWVVLTYWGRTILKDPAACAKQVADAYRQRTLQAQG
jgi:hypothetical protein